MNKFAKLFESDKYGQILIKVSASDNGLPEMKVYVEPPGLGVCEMKTLGKEDSIDAHQYFFEVLEAIDLESAENMAKAIFDGIGL